MDPLKFTTIAHLSHRFCNPLDPGALAQAIARVAPRPGDRVLDVGCGKAALLVELATRHGTSGLGVDLNGAFLAEGRALAARAGVAASVILVLGEASALELAPASFDLGLSIGSAHALGGYRETLRALARAVRPGGHLLLGHGYWMREPEAGYLARLGATRDEMTAHAGNLAAGVALGLEERGAWESRDEDWDRYEDRYADSVERWLAEHPDDPDSPAMGERIRGWREAYRRWGRDTLGFGLYLFRRPETAPIAGCG